MGLKEAGLRGSLRSVSAGVSAIPDSVVHHYDASEDGRSLGSVSSIPDLIGSVALDDGTQVTLTDDGINSDHSYDTDGVGDYLSFSGNQIAPPWTFMCVLQVRDTARQSLLDHGGGGLTGGDGGIDFVDPADDIRYNSSGSAGDEIIINSFNAVDNAFILVLEQTSDDATLRLRDPSVVEATESIASVDWNASEMDFFRDSRDQRYLDSFQAEMAIADSGFDSELENFEEDLLDKWGIN